MAKPESFGPPFALPRIKRGKNMTAWWWNGAVVLTMAGALLFWGALVFEVESFYIDSSAVLGLALVLLGLAQL
jgi:hypothetical protein